VSTRQSETVWFALDQADLGSDWGGGLDKPRVDELTQLRVVARSFPCHDRPMRWALFAGAYGRPLGSPAPWHVPYGSVGV
jgi:hypothetical protein